MAASLRLDPDLHIWSYLDEDVRLVEVPSGKGGRTHWKPLMSDGATFADLQGSIEKVWAQSSGQGERSTPQVASKWRPAGSRIATANILDTRSPRP